MLLMTECPLMHKPLAGSSRTGIEVTVPQSRHISPLEVGPIVGEIHLARIAMLDGPQGLARPPARMRACERLTGAPGKTPHLEPGAYVPFAGFIRSSVELFGALHA